MPSSSITLSTVAGDNTINAVEATSALPLSGTSSGIAAGTLVSIFIDGATTPAAYSFLNADGSWHAVLDATQLAEGGHTVRASVVSASVSSTQNVAVDTLDPTMTIARDDAALSNAGTVHYSVTLSEAIGGVTAANFGLATTGTIAGATITDVTTGDNIHFAVTVDTGTGDGTITLTTTGLHDAAGNGMAGVAFQEQTLQTPAGDVYAMRSGDLNGDGRPDLVSAGSSGIGVWLESVDGTFAFQQYNDQYLRSGLVVDVNNDGKLDLVAISTSSELSVYLGNGDGTFSLPSSFSGGTVARPIGVTTGDFNGDGKVDLAVNSADSSQNAYVTIYLGAGDGSFVQASTYATGAGDPAYVLPDDIATGDLNGDGVADIVATTRYSNGVNVLLGHGDGTFANPVLYATGIALSNGVALGDLNGDGKLDVVATGYEQSGLAVFLNHGDGTLETPTVYASNVYQTLGIADIDGDGILDVVAAGGSGFSAIQIFRGAGDGTLQTAIPYPTTYSVPNGPAIADFNGDGKLDIAAAGALGSFNPGASVFLSALNGPTYTLDRTAPLAPSTPDLTDASDSALNSDNITSVNTPTLTGAAEAGATVVLYDTNGTTVLGTTTADASTGAWSITTSVLIDGDHTITAIATDAAGNVSDPSTGLTVKIDTVTPVVVAPDLAAGSDSALNTDNITSDNTPTFTGTTEAGATVTLFDTDGTTVLGTATTDGTTGAWSITTTALADGDHTVTVQAADAAGHVSTLSSGLTVTIDTAAGTPSILLQNERIGGGTHYSTSGAVVGVAGTTGDQVAYSTDGVTFSSNVPVFFHDGSQDGVKTITVHETDVAGNLATSSITFTLDTIAPQVTSFEKAGASPTNAGSVQFHIAFSEPVLNLAANLFSATGTAASGASVTSLAPVSGTDDEYIVTVATGPDDGALGLTFNGASVTDVAGNHFAPTGAPVVASAAYDFSPLAVPIAAGDLNGDGNPDFVTSDIIVVENPFSITNSLVVHLGNGDGTFQTQPTNIFFGIGLGQAIIADFNNDGHPDLLFPDGNRNGFQELLGNGDGTFQSGLFLHVDGDAQPITFAVADFNNDGRPDIVTRTDGLNIIYTNVGNGDFNADFSVPVGTALSGEDVSGDGDADLVYLSGDNVVVRLGNGTGNGTSVTPVGFGNEISSPVGATPVAKAVADLDGDHTLDIVTVNADGTVTVMRGAGDGTFVKLASYSVNSALSSVVVGDFNGDGKLDIAASGPNDHNIYELLGDGHGGFSAATAVSISGQPGNLAVADFNRDDGSDIVTKPNTPAAVLVLSTYLPVDSGSDYVMDKTITASNVVDHDLVEATSTSAGTASAIATITIDSDTSYDTAALTRGGWTNAGGGLWTQASTYGTATLDTAANTVTFALDNVAADPLTPADRPTTAFTVPVQDLAGNTTTTVVTFTIDGTNDAPTLAPTNAGTLNDTAAPDVLATLTGTLAGHDVDAGAVLTYGLAAGQSATGSYGALSVDPDGHYRYTPNDAAIDAAPAGASLTDAFNVTVSDGVATTQSTLSVHVAGANDVPIITTGATPSVAENTTFVTALTAMDVDGPSAVTFTVTGGANAGLFDVASGALVFRAPHDYEHDPHSYQVEVAASDGAGSSAQMLTVTLTDVNDNAPVFTSGTNATEPENTIASTVVYTAHATDADATAANDTVGYSLTGDDAAKFSIDPSTGDVRFVTAPDYEAPADADHDNHYQLTVHASDGAHDVAQDVTIAITNVDPEILTGSAADDHFVGGALNDVVNGGDGNDTLVGGAGDDLLGGGGGKDSIVGGDGNDTIWGGDGNDDLGGNAGNDIIIGGAGDDIIGGDDGNDVLDGGDGNDTVFGGAGDDQIGAGSGDDIVVGGDGNDTIWGEDGNDTINAGAGNDLVLGGNGADHIGGGTGDDDLRGEAGNDMLWGEDGNDTLTGGAGDDVLLGGAGSDTFVFTAGDGHDIIADFTAAGPEADRIRLAGTDLHSFADVLTHASFNAGSGATTITYGGGETIVLNGVQLGALNVANFVFS